MVLPETYKGGRKKKKMALTDVTTPYKDGKHNNEGYRREREEDSKNKRPA